ncbi:MAG TPA: tRNA (adenosine(37)-N6)-threonylcarbamoyltransferase complex ATPase subunit type 1 TsaE [Candidatus Paceibacterota bacterium]|nr:tRNA (adenosine(37)-N6)-threonylcarbamoyltransferase complex ATPase subunit type 1 TsaE [Candidatus Paceibacterota bacterium]
MQERFTLFDIPRIARQLLTVLRPVEDRATILALSGELGAGKTALAQAIGAALGVAEQMVSPTFVLMKQYQTPAGPFTTIIHIDAYRIENEAELLPIHFEALTQQGNTLIIIEWPEHIAAALAGRVVFRYTLSHLESDERMIEQLP